MLRDFELCVGWVCEYLPLKKFVHWVIGLNFRWVLKPLSLPHTLLLDYFHDTWGCFAAEFEALKNESEMLHQFILLQQQQLQEQQLQQQQFMMGMGWELQGQAANMNIPSNSISDMVQF